MTEIQLRSIAALQTHVATMPEQSSSEIRWRCPECGAENFGLRYSGETPCAECRNYQHPPVRRGDQSGLDAQIRSLEEDIIASLTADAARYRDMRDEAEAALDEVRSDLVQKRRHLRQLREV